MDFSFAGKYMPMFVSGIKLTLIISVISIVLATIVGILVYFLKILNLRNLTISLMQRLVLR